MGNEQLAIVNYAGDIETVEQKYHSCFLYAPVVQTFYQKIRV